MGLNSDEYGPYFQIFTLLKKLNSTAPNYGPLDLSLVIHTLQRRCFEYTTGSNLFIKLVIVYYYIKKPLN